MKKQLPASGQEGSVLLEAMISVVIFSVGILSMIWLQTSASRQVVESKYRLEASFIANQSLGDIWARRQQLASFAVANETVASLPNGKRSIAINGNQVTITISWKSSDDAKVRSYQAVALING